MRFSRQLGLGLAMFALAGVVATGYACDGKNSPTSAANAKGTSATVAASGSHSCSASMASTCTAGAAAMCPHAAGAQAVTASAGGSCDHSATAGAGGCASKGAAAAGGMASSAACSEQSKSAKARGASATAVASHDCDYCASMVACNDELKALGANIQVIMLKNGVAFLYTAGTSNGTNAVQAIMARRTERDDAIARSGSKAHVCDECRSMRQAMTEGKINREVVKIEGGAMAIMTSTDPTIVAKFHRWAAEAKAEHDVAGRAKS